MTKGSGNYLIDIAERVLGLDEAAERRRRQEEIDSREEEE